MAINTDRITELTLKFKMKEISREEQTELDSWLDSSPENRLRFEERVKDENILEGTAIWEEGASAKEANKSRIDWEGTGNEKARVIPLPGRSWRSWMVAAAILLVVGSSAIWFGRENAKEPKPEATKLVTDLAPGGDKAVLILADGRSIALDSAHKGLLAAQGSSRIVKSANGKIVYQAGDKGPSEGFNEVATPKGGQYSLTLQDGTEIWLNAQSSVRFPTAFVGNSREVAITGEVYFKVAKDKAHPFRVTVAGVIIEDLGTEFNVQAYADEKMLQATLVEGRISVKKGADVALLTPGQQVQVSNTLGPVIKVDVSPVIAWKNGLFEFNGADIETIMRAISRWYNVDIKYEAQKDMHTFTGQMNRNSRASEVLQVLSTSGYHFRIEGKVITVLP